MPQKSFSQFEGLLEKRRGLGALPLSLRLFLSFFLVVAGFSYLSLLASIWSDTQMRLSVITEAYGTIGNIELIQHSFRYLFWFFGVFLFIGFLFQLTAVSEKFKVFFAVSVPCLILADIGFAWLIRVDSLFTYGLAASGFFLASSFLGMSSFILHDLWIRKTS